MILRFVGPRSLDFVPSETFLARGRLRVQTELIGISSGTELLLWRGEYPQNYSNPNELEGLRQLLNYPIAYGYMAVGRLEDGTRVFAYAPHGDELWVDASSLVPIGNLPAEDAVFLANMETALHLYQSARPFPGQRLAVWGLGVVGLLLGWLLTRFNPGTSWAVEPLPSRRFRAEELGLRSLTPENASEIIHEQTEGQGLEVAFELSGRPDALDSIFPVMAEEGRIVLGSWYGRRRHAIDLGSDFHRKRLSFHASQVSVPLKELGPTWNVRRRRLLALDLLQQLRPRRWITHRFALKEAAAAYELLENHPEQCFQVVLMP